MRFFNLLASVFGVAAGSPINLTPAPAFRGPTQERGKAGKESGQYGKALAGYIARKQAQKQAERKVHPLRDKHGAITLVGRDRLHVDATGREMRRIWLAGISAQRGY